MNLDKSNDTLCRRGSRGGRGVFQTLLEFSKYTSKRTTFSALSGGIFTCTFKKFLARFARLFMYVPSLLFDDFSNYLGNRASFKYFLYLLPSNQTPDIYSSTRQFQRKCQNTDVVRIFKIDHFLLLFNIIIMHRSTYSINF